MYRTQAVLALLALFVGLAHSFSWDIVVAGNRTLQFYDNNGTRTNIEVIPSQRLTSLAYDPVNNRVLFSDYAYAFDMATIYSFDIATRDVIYLHRCFQYAYLHIAYDPATQLLFWIETESYNRNAILSKPAYANAVEENLLINLDSAEPIFAFTVDSCGGYIYWGTQSKIERARFDGSKREVIIVKKATPRSGITIDQLTQKMYWIDNQLYGTAHQMSIESADLNGENRRTLYIKQDGSKEAYYDILVSKGFIYWRTISTIFQLTKNPLHDKKVETKQFSVYQNESTIGMAFNYKTENQTLLLPINPATNDSASHNVTTDVSLYSVHGTKVSEEFRCKCTEGYIGERCEVSVCHNYCLQGDCSVSAEGKPKCRCNAGYSGQRCEITAFSTPTIVTDAASCSAAIDRLNIISQELNNTLKGWRIDMDAMAKFKDEVKGTLRVWRTEIETSIQSKSTDSIEYTISG